MCTVCLGNQSTGSSQITNWQARRKVSKCGGGRKLDSTDNYNKAWGLGPA